eukprot:jgi/Picsp_1/6618/NSC_03961-R1_smp-30 gluconolaconase lre-like region-containing protein
MHTIIISLIVIVLLIPVFGLVKGATSTLLRPLDEAVGSPNPVLNVLDESVVKVSELTGTWIAQDKSKGVTFLIRPSEGVYKAVLLPTSQGNHETAVSEDGLLAITTHYDTARLGDGEGGGVPGSDVLAIEIPNGDLGTSGGNVLLRATPNPLQASAPHGVVFLNDGSIVATAQLNDSLVLFPIDLESGNKVYNLTETGCITPHLVRAIPANVSADRDGVSNLVVTGCRATNPGVSDRYPGKVALVNLETGDSVALDAGLGAEGIAVTSQGDVWVGGNRGNIVSVYGFRDGEEPSLDTFYKKADVSPTVRNPLRLAYDPILNRMAVASFTSNVSEPNFFMFDGTTLALLSNTTIDSTNRGRVNMEGLTYNNGYYFTGGFDNQVIVFIDPSTGSVVAEIEMPRCSLPEGLNVPTFLPANEASSLNLTGSNNWSGGYCNETMRNPFDTRFLTLDGFEWSPSQSMSGDQAAPSSSTALSIMYSLCYFIILYAFCYF